MAKTKKSKNIKIRPIILLAFLLIAVVFTSGCVLQEYWPVFGSDVVKISRSPTTLGTNNVLVVSNKYTIPEKTYVVTDMDMQLSITLKNNDNDPEKPANNVYVDLFDATVFKGFKDGEEPKLCNDDRSFCQPDACGIAEKCTMPMGAEKPIRFRLKSPTLDEIAGIITKSKLHFLVSYEYSGSSSYQVMVVDYNEIVRRQQAGEPLSTSLSEIRGSGPIKIDVTERVPFITTSTDSIIIFKIRDTGNGELKGSNITKGKLTIEFPKGLVPDLKHLEGDFAGSGGATTGGTGSATKKCSEFYGHQCVSGEQMNHCLENTGEEASDCSGTNEKCCVTCESKGSNCGGEPCVCTNANNCILDSGLLDDGKNRFCASGEKCCAAKSTGAVYASGVSNPQWGVAYADTTPTPEPSMFSCSEKTDKIICTNNKDIKLFRDESEPLWFKIKNAPQIDVPHKSFYINARVEYTYELRDSVDIEVKPPTA